MTDIEPNAVIVVDYRVDTDDPEYDQNVRIMNSYRITDKEQQEEIILLIIEYNRNNPVSPNWCRSLKSMKIEWQAHNDGYTLSPLAVLFLNRDIRGNCQHVDFNNEDEPLGYWEYYLK